MTEQTENILIDLQQTRPLMEKVNHTIRRYEFAAQFIAPGDRVLDICCAGGYGTELTRTTNSVNIGVDRDAAAIEFARQRYPKCRFIQADVITGQGDTLSPLSQRRDVTMMFEMLDHLTRIDAEIFLFRQAFLTMKLLFLSLPQDHKRKSNPYHLAEWSDAEIKDILSTCFQRVVKFEQRWATGEIVFPINERRSLTIWMAIR